MADFLILPAHKNIASFGSASATVDTDYLAAWLNDGRPGRPARGTGSSFSATITNASSGNVNVVAIINHNLGAVTLGGGLSGTIPASSTQQDGIPLNTFLSFTVVGSVGSFTVSGTSSSTWVVGEVMAGEATSLTLPYYQNDEIEETDLSRPIDMDLSSIPPYDSGLAGIRKWSATWPALSTSELDGLLTAFRAQRNRTRPTLIVRRTSINDAMCGWITGIQHGPSEAPNKHEVSLSFEEIPRVRW